jgi:CubicO group peptidase (beta-lactamase class C family)
MVKRRRLLGMTLAGAALLAARPSRTSAGPANQEDVPPTAASAVTIPGGRIDRAVAALDGLAANLLRKTGVPGMAVAVVHRGETVYARGFGVRKADTAEHVDQHTVFQLASVSKPLASTVVAGVVGRGTVNWGDPVVKYIPSFRLSDPYVGRHVTIADMFAHRSGLPDHAGDLLEDLGYDRTTILQRLALEPLAPFRITYRYTNFGLTAAAQAVAEATGAAWEDLSQQVLYGPLGMTSTSSRYADYAHARNKAVLHVKVGHAWEAKYTRNPDAQSPAGGASSSVHDMANWLVLQLAIGKYHGRQLIDTDALLATHLPQLMSGPIATPNGRASFYGLGWSVTYDQAGRLRLSHSGAFALGAATTIHMLPSENLGIVVLTNGMPIGVPETIAADFFDLAELGTVQRDWYAAYSPLFAAMYANPSKLAGTTPPTNPRTALPEAAYAGTYANRFYGPATVAFRHGRLVMMLGPLHNAFPLTHWDGNTFSYLPSGENAVGVSAMTFSIGSDGHAARFVVENLDGEGLGTFIRL